MMKFDTRSHPRYFHTVILAVAGMAVATIAEAQLVIAPAASGNIASLKTVRPPQPPELSTYVQNQAALVALGKALFWDMQAGGDGKQACASCHYHAGADHRGTNQIANPMGPFTPNATMTAGDFPFHKLADYSNNASAVMYDTTARAGSAGLTRRQFLDVVPGSAVDNGYDLSDSPAFSMGGIDVRRTTGRNAPTVINAAFNVRNFWDSRARDIFTVFTPFGDADPNSNVVMEVNGHLVKIKARLQDSSLASQSVGPPNNPTEMSEDGRTWQKLGKKMLNLRPLAKQHVDSQDSVLAPYVVNRHGAAGLDSQYTYASLIQTAFKAPYWNSSKLMDSTGAYTGSSSTPWAAAIANTSRYTQMEYNFALFWGTAVQAYEATLISDDSRFDQSAEGRISLTPLEAKGLNIFQGKAACVTCHAGPEFTAAAFTTVNKKGATQLIDNGLTDTGYFRTGVRPIGDDIGIGGTDGFGQPLSIAAVQNPAGPLAVNGAFKTPTLRNTEFTGPFMHNGGLATLDQIVDFYSRGGDFPAGGVGPGIKRLGLSADESAALVAFLKALSDDRVRYERAPFDHPELCVANGHSTPLQVDTSDSRFTQDAKDKMVGFPAVGKLGNSAPLQTFEEMLAGVGNDGSRAHNLHVACSIH